MAKHMTHENCGHHPNGGLTHGMATQSREKTVRFNKALNTATKAAPHPRNKVPRVSGVSSKGAGRSHYSPKYGR